MADHAQSESNQQLLIALVMFHEFYDQVESLLK
jgi:hypothetical protein